MWGFANYRKCDRCGESFCGQGFVCPACKAKAARRRYWANRRHGRNPNAPTPAQEAYAQGDPALYAQALRGELD